MGHGIQGTPSEQRSAVISSSAWILKEEKESYETRALATNQTRLLFIVERMESPQEAIIFFTDYFFSFVLFPCVAGALHLEDNKLELFYPGDRLDSIRVWVWGVGWETRTRNYHNTRLSLYYGHGRHQRSLGVETTGLVYYYLHITQCGR